MPYQVPFHRPNAPRKGQAHQRNRQQTRAMHTGSKAWKAIRIGVLEEAGFLCVDCGGFGDQVDHDDGDSHNNDPANLKCRCLACHSRKTRREQNAQGRSDADR